MDKKASTPPPFSVDSQTEAPLQDQEPLKVPHVPFYKRPVTLYVLLLSVFAVGGGIYLFGFFFSNPNNLFSQYFKPLEKSLSPHTSNELYQEALEAYFDQDYEDAIPLFEELMQDTAFVRSEGHQAALFYGTAHLAQDESRQALSIMEEFELHPDIKDDIRWYQALGYLQMEERDNAIHMLVSLARNPASKRAEKARDVLMKISPW